MKIISVSLAVSLAILVWFDINANDAKIFIVVRSSKALTSLLYSIIIPELISPQTIIDSVLMLIQDMINSSSFVYELIEVSGWWIASCGYEDTYILQFNKKSLSMKDILTVQ